MLSAECFYLNKDFGGKFYKMTKNINTVQKCFLYCLTDQANHSIILSLGSSEFSQVCEAFGWTPSQSGLCYFYNKIGKRNMRKVKKTYEVISGLKTKCLKEYDGINQLPEGKEDILIFEILIDR